MRLTGRIRVDADVLPGFAATEARALQTSLGAALTPAERAAGAPVPAEAVLDAGRDDALVVVVRNLVVGFVPPERADDLAGQVAAARRRGRGARLVAPALLHRDAGLWRVWVGPVPDGGVPAPDDTADVLAAPDPAVLGIPLRRTEG